MATNNMHNFTTLIKRLEAATARLEDIASSAIELPEAVPALKGASPQSALSGLSTPAAPSITTPAPTPAPAPVPQEPVPESIEEFDAFINTSVQKWAKISSELGGLIAEQAVTVVQGFREQRKFLLITTKSKKPDLTGSEMSVYQDLLKPINQALVTVSNLKDKNRGSPVFNHLSCVSEGFMVLAWVTVDNRPYKMVEDMLSSAQFFGNRVLKEFKDQGPKHAEWVQAYYQIFRDLIDYVKNYFPNGVPWNPKGRPAQEVIKALAGTSPSAPAPASGAPPPPPPPGPPPVLQINEVKAAPAAAGGIGAVFSELNKGEGVTKGLKKVDKSQMTHKNPDLRASSVVPEGSVRGKSPAPAPSKKPKPDSMRVKKPPKKELDGNKWTVENYDKEAEPITIQAEISHSILISKCNNTTIIIRGKANAVTIENTSRLSLVLDSLVSSVDAVKSQNFALQVLGTIPTVLLDQIDGAQVYFSKEGTSTRIFSSKSAGINLNVISGPDEDYKEVPLPSQICSYFDEEKGDLVNEIVSHSG
ncbi:adenylate cyclase associated N terminal-domain-containing protein [Lasiosphaeria hispida]|uniref:Adenylyl cyclase-associated protein n=1 Tax=Lasiosphaeria hispida TaxID=260671 RepID=A0AAJ0HIW0_9PEZI|nr:adenylate cyclase associated N terminal-domain-containing protein [Lasiosphaeria hispida]